MNSSKLFSVEEKGLLFKSQRAIKLANVAMREPDPEILTTAKLIEDARIEYQLLKDIENSELTFIEFLMPRVTVHRVNITNWEKVNSYFDFK